MSDPTYSLISDEIIENIITQVRTIRRAADRMNESDSLQTNTAIDNIEGMIKHDTFSYVCNVPTNCDIGKNAISVLDRMSESLEVDDA